MTLFPLIPEFEKRTKKEIDIWFGEKAKESDKYEKKRHNENNYRRMNDALFRINKTVREIKERYKSLADSGLLILTPKVNKDIQKRINEEIENLKELSSVVGEVTGNKEKLLKV